MKITRIILISGLILLPYYEGILYILMPSGKIPEFIDLRQTKEYIALGLALALTVAAWLEVKKLECPNKWTLFFLMFLFFNLSKSPIGVVNPTVDVSLLGSYSAEFKVFAFFLMFCSLASCRFSQDFIDRILKTILMCAVVMSGYMILQACNLDQIYKPKPEYFISAVKSLRIAGFFGQPTLALPFLVMAIPFAVHFKNWPALGILSIAALLTGSDFAIISLVALWFIYSYYSKRRLIFGVLVIVGIVCVKMFFINDPQLFNDNGRFFVWGQILNDVFSGQINGVEVRIGMFGAGLNNFGKVFTALHQSAYTRAHNEYLQILWCCGVVGLGNFLMIHLDIFKTALLCRANKRMKPIISALIMLMLCSCGTFVWQLGAYQFYTAVLIALVYQIRNNKRRVESCS